MMSEFCAMALVGLHFFLEKVGKQTEDCERDAESVIGRIDIESQFQSYFL